MHDSTFNIGWLLYILCVEATARGGVSFPSPPTPPVPPPCDPEIVLEGSKCPGAKLVPNAATYFYDGTSDRVGDRKACARAVAANVVPTVPDFTWEFQFNEVTGECRYVPDSVCSSPQNDATDIDRYKLTTKPGKLTTCEPSGKLSHRVVAVTVPSH